VARFYDRIRNPYLTDVEVIWEGIEVEDAFPARIPDLFQGRPLVVHARTGDTGRGAVRVRGTIAGRTWEKRIPLEIPRGRGGNPAVGSLWARAAIGDLERRMVRGETPELVDAVTQLGLRHRLVTKYTSFVAVEERMVVSDGRPTAVRVPVDMPEGVDFEGVFGRHEAKEELLAKAMSSQGFAGGTPGSSPPATFEVERSVESSGLDRLRALGYVADKPSRSDLRGQATESDAPADEPAANAIMVPAVRLSLSCAGREVALGGKITLTLEIRNDGRSGIHLPADLLSGKARPAIRVIDGNWTERTLAATAARLGATRKTLEPGAVQTVTLVLDTADAAIFSGPGVYHLFVEGGAFRSQDSNRITVRIEAR
jgi:hypothetical protein